MRLAKARKGIETVGDTHIQMDNIGIMEISEIRFMSQAVNQMMQLTRGVDRTDDMEGADMREESMEGSVGEDD